MSHTATTSRCRFCKEPMVVNGLWLICKPCGVDFTWASEELHIKFDREWNDWYLALNLYPEQNRMVLGVFRINSDSEAVEYRRIVLEDCMADVTPQNCLDKMKLIMVFQ